MKYFVKKVWCSALLSILFIATAITTTYAWYAMTYNNDIDDFGFNISGTNSVFISTDGVNFSSNLSALEIKKAILSKRGINPDDLSESRIDDAISAIKLDAVTPTDYTDLSKGFKQITDKEEVESNGYLAFDIYLTSDYIGTSTSGQAIYFGSEKVISAKNKSVDLTHFNVGGEHPTLGNINKRISVNMENACRIGVERSNVSTIGEFTDERFGTDSIYTPGKEEPSNIDGIYNFGGINATPNVALNYYNNLSNTNLEVPETNRVDYELDSNEVIARNEGLVDGKMVRLTIYVWLEGWDADCFDVFKGETFDLSLSFATYRSS